MFAVFVCLYVLLLPFITTAAFSGVINDDDDDSNHRSNYCGSLLQTKMHPLPEKRVAHFYLHDNFGQRRPAFIIFTGNFRKGM